MRTDRLPAFVFDSAAFPPAERFDRFREAADAILDVRRAEDDPGDFRIRTDVWRLGRMAVNSRADASAIRLERQKRRLRADGIDHYVVSLMLDAGCVIDADGCERAVAAGSVVVLDMARSLRMAVPGAHSLACSVPRDALDALLPSARSWHGATAHGAAGLMLAEFLASLPRRLPTLSPTEAPFVERAALNLLAAGLAPSAERLELAGEPVAQTLRQAVRRAVDARLSDPDLSPDRLAQAVGVSRTVLYRLLEPEGGVAAFIRARRLRTASQMLAQAGAPRISHLAYACGFRSESQFCRAFKREFGASPGEMRGQVSAPSRSASADGDAGELYRRIMWEHGA